MHKQPNSLQKVDSKTTKVELWWYDAAILSHFQSQRGTPEFVRTSYAAHQLPSKEPQLTMLCSVTGDHTFDGSNIKSVLTGSKLLRDIKQEVIRLICRIKKMCVDRVCPNSVRMRTTHSKQPVYPRMIDGYGRSQTGASKALQQLVQRRSVYLATDEEYNFRRVKRQRVFHEKGNVD